MSLLDLLFITSCCDKSCEFDKYVSSSESDDVMVVVTMVGGGGGGGAVVSDIIFVLFCFVVVLGESTGLVFFSTCFFEVVFLRR